MISLSPWQVRILLSSFEKHDSKLHGKFYSWIDPIKVIVINVSYILIRFGYLKVGYYTHSEVGLTVS